MATETRITIDVTKLARRLAGEIEDGHLFLYEHDRYGITHDGVVLIEQLIKDTIDTCAAVADQWANSHSCTSHEYDPCCHVRTGNGIARAIRHQSGEMHDSASRSVGSQKAKEIRKGLKA